MSHDVNKMRRGALWLLVASGLTIAGIVTKYADLHSESEATISEQLEPVEDRAPAFTYSKTIGVYAPTADIAVATSTLQAIACDDVDDVPEHAQCLSSWSAPFVRTVCNLSDVETGKVTAFPMTATQFGRRNELPAGAEHWDGAGGLATVKSELAALNLKLCPGPL